MPQLTKQRTFPGGMTIIYYGAGKGKTTAAIGAAVRAAGYGWKVIVLQFMKGEWPSGEEKTFAKLPNCTFQKLGKGFVRIWGDTKPLRVHKEAAQKALTIARKTIHSKRYDLVVLDEIISSAENGLLSVRDIARLMDEKPKNLHMILTGHKPYPLLLSRADLVTEMKEIKHPFRKRYLAVKGIDY